MKKIPDQLDKALPFNVYRVALLFRNELMKALADYQLTPEQWQVMRVLWLLDEEELNQNDVAHVTLKNKHTVSRILARLERDGWVTKSPKPGDARALIIKPTTKGMRLKDEVPQKLHVHFKPILGVLKEEEREQVLEMLQRFRRVLGDE